MGIKVLWIARPGYCAADGATGKLMALPEELLDLGGLNVADEEPVLMSEV